MARQRRIERKGVLCKSVIVTADVVGGVASINTYCYQAPRVMQHGNQEILGRKKPPGLSLGSEVGGCYPLYAHHGCHAHTDINPDALSGLLTGIPWTGVDESTENLIERKA